jgi:hypothetical protein
MAAMCEPREIPQAADPKWKCSFDLLIFHTTASSCAYKGDLEWNFHATTPHYFAQRELV